MDKLTEAFAIIDRLTQDPDDDDLSSKMRALETFVTAIMARHRADRLANDLEHCPGQWEAIALPERLVAITIGVPDEPHYLMTLDRDVSFDWAVKHAPSKLRSPFSLEVQR